MNGKLYKQARHYMQARLFTDFAKMHLQFFPYVISLKRVYLRRQNLSRPPVHIYGQVSKPPKLPFVKPNAPVHVRDSSCGGSEAVTMGSPPRGRNCRESHRLQVSSPAWGTESSESSGSGIWRYLALARNPSRRRKNSNPNQIRHMKWQRFHNLDRSSPGSTRTAPSAAHHDGGEKYAAGVTTSKVLARNNIIIGTWNLGTLRIACNLEE